MLVVWTERAAASAGGEAQLRAAIQHAVVYTNVARASSFVDQTLRIVHLQRIAYDETTTKRIEDDAEHLSREDGVIDEVRGLRERYGADLVSMVVKRDPMTCGAAEQLAAAPPDRQGFSVVDVACLPYALAHETGHNAGAGHEAGASGLPGMFSYSHALVSSVSGVAERCGTVVSAPDGQTRMAYYSSPAVNFGFGTEPFLLGKTPEPEIASPQPGTQLTGSNATFRWDARGYPATDWHLTIGSAPGEIDIYDSGPLGPTQSHTVHADFPDDGSPVYVRLYFWHPSTGVRFTEAVYNLIVRWKGNAAVAINPVTLAERILAQLPGAGVSIQHTGEPDYRRFVFTLMMVGVPPGGSAVYTVNMVTGERRETRRGNGEPMWIRSFRDGLHIGVVETGADNTTADVFVLNAVTGEIETVKLIPDAGNVRQFGNFVERTSTEWVFEFVGSHGTQDTTQRVTIEQGGPCYGQPTGTPTADNARTLRETAAIVATLQPRLVPLTYTPTMVTTGTGAGTLTGAGVYPAGSVVTLTATPDPGSAFVGFGGHPDCLNGQVVMTGDRTCEARFDLLVPASSYLLRVVRAGPGVGQVTSSPPGILCGTDCRESYPDGILVSLTATATTGSTFLGWGGDADCADGTVTMSATRFCVASFDSSTRMLTIVETGTGSGLVVSDIAGIHCGTDCVQPYSRGTVVRLTATPAAGSVFTGWGGAADCGDGIVTIAADIACVVTFSLPATPLRVLVDVSRSDAIWWSPQTAPYNTAMPHRGKAVVDALSGFGLTVVERSSPPTCVEIGQAHLVVVSERMAWTPRDIAAYLRYVNAGGRLVLLEDVDGPSDLASALGLSFSGWTLSNWPLNFTPHPITLGVTMTFAGGKLLGEWPASAQILGRLAGPSNAATGLMPFGLGQVFFTGDTEGLYSIPQPFFDNLFSYMLANASPVNACLASFIDDPIVPGITVVRAVHITELRQRVDALRITRGLRPFPWTDVPLSPVVRSVHVTELRTALSQAYAAAGSPSPPFTDPALGAGSVIRAVHINELRHAVQALE